MNSLAFKEHGQRSATSEESSGSAPLNLSSRTANEILALKFSPDDIFMADGLLAAKQGLAFLGPGGVGKSRLGTQVAICTILGQPFLGLPVTCAKKRWLIIQAENSNRRLQYDLQKHRTAYTNSEWTQINEHLTFHTLEHELDDRLRLGDSNNAKSLAKLIRQHKPDIVVLDPLGSFGRNLNSDEGMLGTLQDATRLCRIENPETSIIVVHHTLTGREGFKKAVGHDRASYGRGSKALHAWARGQINIAPGDPEDTRKLMIACGKNSNGREFDPFGAILNTDTMLYEIDPAFNIGIWKQQMCGVVEAKHKLTPEDVANYVREMPMSRAALVEEICNDIGCKKSTAYSAIKLAETKTITMTQTKEYTIAIPENSRMAAAGDRHPV